MLGLTISSVLCCGYITCTFIYVYMHEKVFLSLVPAFSNGHLCNYSASFISKWLHGLRWSRGDKVDLRCIGEETTSEDDLLNTDCHLFYLQYGMDTPTTMTKLRFTLFTTKKEKFTILKLLSPTDEALQSHEKSICKLYFEKLLISIIHHRLMSRSMVGPWEMVYLIPQPSRGQQLLQNWWKSSHVAVLPTLPSAVNNAAAKVLVCHAHHSANVKQLKNEKK